MNDLKRLPYQPLKALPRPAVGTSEQLIALPEPDRTSGLPLMGALWQRKSTRTFEEQALPPTLLSELLWAADGVNRPQGGGRTAPTPHGENVIDVYAALPSGLYRYDPVHHYLQLKLAEDVRSLTGYQDFVGMAPLDLIYVVNHGRMQDMPPKLRETFAAASAGAMAQNVYLYCASTGLGTVIRGWLNRQQLAEHMSLNEDEVPILSQTVGYPAKDENWLL
ncbi:nitroreductase family protein [Cupriavidus sp. BIS7]|uniref:nitroreductase family protein n=1 Tax=Cupriavidus sp. BIS7 TaxID=1217718 RepID=UPI000474EAE5|nr:nitroreductase family protein [Cupriavidus sp. BIS7]